jgi:hypothetical protein
MAAGSATFNPAFRDEIIHAAVTGITARREGEKLTSVRAKLPRSNLSI